MRFHQNRNYVYIPTQTKIIHYTNVTQLLPTPNTDRRIECESLTPDPQPDTAAKSQLVEAVAIACELYVAVVRDEELALEIIQWGLDDVVPVEELVLVCGRPPGSTELWTSKVCTPSRRQLRSCSRYGRWGCRFPRRCNCGSAARTARPTS